MLDRQSYLEWQRAAHEAEMANQVYTFALRDGLSTPEQAERVLRLRRVAEAKLKAMASALKSQVT